MKTPHPPSFENPGGPFGLGCLSNNTTILQTVHAINLIKDNEKTTKAPKTTIIINPTVISHFYDISDAPIASPPPKDNDAALKPAITTKPSLNNGLPKSEIMGLWPKLNEKVIKKAIKQNQFHLSTLTALWQKGKAIKKR